MPTDNNNPLSIKKLDTIHVSHGDQKILSVAIVLKDIDKNIPFWDKLGILDRLIVTDVQTHNNSDKVDIFFRNINVAETISLTREGIISTNGFHAVFGEFLLTLAGQSESTDNVLGQYENLSSGTMDLEAFWEHIGEVTELLSRNIKIIPEDNDQTIYKITVPLAFAHLAQVLYSKSNSPSFVVTSESKYKELLASDKDLALEDFAILDYPYPTTNEYYATTASITQKVDGYYPLNLNPVRSNELRGEVLSLVVNLAKGSPDALVKAFGFLNPVKKGLNAYVKRRMTGTSRFTSEDIEMVYFAECVDRLYKYLEPSSIAALIQENGDNEEYYAHATIVDDIFADPELNDSFSEILSELTEEKTLNELSSVEEIVQFYASGLWGQPGFPEDMMNLVPKINLPVLEENDLMSATSLIEETPDNSGSLAVAKLIACAVRYNRLLTITRATPASINPIGFLVAGLTYPDELEIWVVIESVRRLAEVEGISLFKEVYTAGLTNPTLAIGLVNRNQLMRSGLTHVLHRLGHVLEQEFAADVATDLLPDNSFLAGFVESVYSSANEDSDINGTSMEEDEEDSLCSALESALSVYNDIDFQYQGDDFVEAVGEYILALGQLRTSYVLSDDKGIHPKDTKWKAVLNEWLVRLINP